MIFGLCTFMQNDPGGTRIEPITEPCEQRPFWSVMIPVYQGVRYLPEALESVLVQDPGPKRMQIEVVDDCSPTADVRAIVERVAPDRVSFFRQPRNVGLARNWNTCIGRARGHWVHILHQDDFVLRGFYQRLEEAVRCRDDVCSAFSRCFYMDEDGFWTGLTPLEMRSSGVLPNWLERIAGKNRTQCAAMAVRRSAYETLGGFRTDLKYTLDWEMWIRLAANFKVWYEPRTLAAYRTHNGSTSAALQREIEDIPEIRRCAAMALSLVPPGNRSEVRRASARWGASMALHVADAKLRAGDHHLAVGYFREMLRCSFSLWVGRRIPGFAFRFCKALFSKHARKGFPTPGKQSV